MEAKEIHCESIIISTEQPLRYGTTFGTTLFKMGGGVSACAIYDGFSIKSRSSNCRSGQLLVRKHITYLNFVK
jgi:hypothetical protein